MTHPQKPFWHRLFAGLPGTTAGEERDYLQLWRQHAADAADPLQQALIGGYLADGFAWIFIAGYQAAIRRTFVPHGTGETQDSWLAFAATEDRKPDSPLPGVTWTGEGQGAGDGIVLNGYKTWVAASRSVSHLVVKAGRGEQARYCLVPVAAEGFTLSHRDAPGMLPDLSQGVAELSQVRVPAAAILTDEFASVFGRMEVLYIYSAFLAYVFRVTANDSTEGIDAALTLAAQLHEFPGLMDSNPAPQVSGLSEQLAAQVQELRRQLGASLFAHDERWQRDQQLIRMYDRS